MLRLDLGRDGPVPGEVETHSPYSFGPSTTRSRLRPSRTSTPNGPTCVFIRSAPSSRDARTTRCTDPRSRQRERVGHPQVRVLAQPHDQHRVPGQRERVEVVPVVEVPVRRPDVPHHLRDLVHGIVVKRRQGHDSPSRITSTRREQLLLYWKSLSASIQSHSIMARAIRDMITVNLKPDSTS